MISIKIYIIPLDRANTPSELSVNITSSWGVFFRKMDVFRYVTRCGKIFENKKDTGKAIDNPLNITFIF